MHQNKSCYELQTNGVDQHEINELNSTNCGIIQDESVNESHVVHDTTGTIFTPNETE
jgi:hypothetical protein